MCIHHLDWFEDDSILVGYRTSSAIGSSLGLVGVTKNGENSFTFKLMCDLKDPVCDIQSTDEAEALSSQQKYFTRYLKEWLVLPFVLQLPHTISISI